MSQLPPPNPPYEPPENNPTSPGAAPEAGGQPASPPPGDGGVQPPAPDWRDSLHPARDEYRTARQEARAERRAARQARREERWGSGGSSWIVGVVLVLLGVVFLLQNLSGFALANWWAVFLLIPAVAAFSNAWRSYHADGRMSYPARNSLIGGIILTLLAGFFLLNLSLGLFWPLLLVLGGVLLLLNGLLP